MTPLLSAAGLALTTFLWVTYRARARAARRQRVLDRYAEREIALATRDPQRSRYS
jgi:hypothetical protein